jgi:hypothetical protein
MADAGEDFTGSEPVLDPRLRDLQAPTEDLVEQATPMDPRDVPQILRTPFEADEYDVIEQSRIVDYDDEDR